MTDAKTMEEIQTKWDLTPLYESTDDPQIKKDVQRTKERYDEFRDKWHGRDDYLEDAEVLKDALEDYEALSEEFNSSKPVHYFRYLKALDSNNQTAESMMNKLSQELTEIGNILLFFSLSLGNIPEQKQQEFLQDKRLEHYHYYLERLFLESKYDLSEDEEKILSMTSLPRYGMWVDGVEKSINKHTVEFEGETIPFAEAMNKIHEIPNKDKRRELHKKCMQELRDVGDFAESEINAVVTNKKITDKLRGFEKPYSATILGYENEEDTVLNLVDTVTDAFDVSHDFYRLKASLLDEDVLTYADRQAPIGEVEKEIKFEESISILREHFGNVDEQYRDILDRMLENGQIDVYPKEGKRGGAFCSGQPHQPTYVLLNHVPSFQAVTTFAHEMGHAIHSERSKEQPVMYEGYTTSVAEVASTLFENVVFDAVFEGLDKEEKKIALHDKINRDISTVFRQIALFNFELELHETIREEGSISQTDIAELHNKHMGAYLGDHFELTEDDGYFSVYWPHIRYFFYSYSYTYGDLISRALYARYDEDSSYVKQIDEFLRAGGSKSPYDIFNDIGIDTQKPDIFEEGIQSIKNDIETLETLRQAE